MAVTWSARRAGGPDSGAAPAEISALVGAAHERLCHPRPQARREGLAALVSLADGSPGHRQAVVRVLGAYLRAPYHPRRHSPADRKVRLAVLDAVREHLLDPSSPTSWCGLQLDLSGAVFDGGSLAGAQVHGGLRLARAHIAPGGLDLRGVVVDRGGCLELDGARVEGGLRLDGARIGDGRLSARDVRLVRGVLSLADVVVDGGQLSLYESVVAGGALVLDGFDLRSGSVFFTALTVRRGTVSMRGARLDGATTSVSHVVLSGGRLALTGLQVRGVPLDLRTVTVRPAVDVGRADLTVTRS